jgi:hypothetical protein
MELQRLTRLEDSLTEIFKKEWLQITLFTLLSISAPLFIKSPQILVGSIVNFSLFLSAKRLGFKKTLPSILLPSLIAYSSNILFEGATHFLIFFVPVIFIGNSIYVLLNQYIKNSFFSVLFSSVCKSIFLYIFAFVFVNEDGLPEVFLSSMGVMQFVTAVIGGILGFVTTEVFRESKGLT